MEEADTLDMDEDRIHRDDWNEDAGRPVPAWKQTGQIESGGRIHRESGKRMQEVLALLEAGKILN